MAVGDVDGVKAALARGADTNARDGKGWTALMYAADKGYALIVPALLGAGADPNLRLADGATALFIAAVHGHSEIIGFLMEAGAKISIKGPKGKTATHAARARYGNRQAAMKGGEPDSIVALVEGKTLKDYLEAPPAPICSDNLAPACWMEVRNQPKCYIWKSRDLSTGTKLTLDRLTLTWFGGCIHSKASGMGKLIVAYEYKRSGSSGFSSEKGEYRNGKKHGHWVEEGDTGPYVDGEKHGHWIERSTFHNQAGLYVDGKKHGDWVERDPRSGYATTKTYSYVDGELVGSR